MSDEIAERLGWHEEIVAQPTVLSEAKARLRDLSDAERSG